MLKFKKYIYIDDASKIISLKDGTFKDLMNYSCRKKTFEKEFKKKKMTEKIRRSEGMTCKTCMYSPVKKGNVRRCRRHAPTMSGYPVVFENDWCGDHKLDELNLKNT